MSFPENGLGARSVAQPSVKRDPVLLLLLLVGLALFAYVVVTPAKAPVPLPVRIIDPVPAPAKPSPCGPNRCPYRSETSFGLNFEYGCPWCEKGVAVALPFGDFRAVSQRCINCGNRVRFSPARGSGWAIVATPQAAGVKPATPTKQCRP